MMQGLVAALLAGDPQPGPYAMRRVADYSASAYLAHQQLVGRDERE
jgi:hypothetical protein